MRREETSRREIEHGPQKYPGLVLTLQGHLQSGRPLFVRRLVVVAEPRVYDVAVNSSKEEWLQGTDVKAFFDSFTITE